MIEILKAVLFGIVEGITEWLPVSSTGHIILLDEFIQLNASDEFKSMFDVVIQLGAILAVIVLFFHKLNPFAPSKSAPEKKQTWELWFKVIAAILPSGVVGILLDDWMDAHLHNGIVVSIALIVYGIAFILVERRNTRGKYTRISGKDGPTVVFTREQKVENVFDITYKTAILIGLFQCLSLVPGTSRSGSTILIVGCVVSLIVSLLVIKGLMDYVRRHSLSAFGVYRIVLGIIVLTYFGFLA